jgi:integrase
MTPRERPLRYSKNIAHDKVTGRYHVLKKIGGRQIKRAFPTRRAAIAFLEHLSLRAAGVAGAEIEPTVEEAFGQYEAELKRLGRSRHTIRYYQLRRKPLTIVLGKYQLSRVTQAMVNDYIDMRSHEVGNGTINKELTALRTIYTAANIAPAWRLKALTHRPKRKRVHQVETVQKLWSRLSRPTRCAVGLCLFAGFRAEEVWRAEASWVHGDEIDCEIEKSGGETNRTWLVKTLRDILPKTGKLVRKSESAIRYELEAASKALGIIPPYLGPGAFRGHCSTYATELGYSREECKLVLGHQFGDVTDRYIHSQQIEKKKKVLEAVEKYVLGSHQVVTPNVENSLEYASRTNVVEFREVAGSNGK